jgi:hypothetical protein
MGRAKLKHIRDGVPVAETNVCATFVAAFKLVQERPELRLGRNPTPLDGRVDGKIIEGGHDRPQMCDFHGNGTVQGEDLSMGLVRCSPVTQ